MHIAQYAIKWSTIAGGGGTSTGGVYSVSGTIGQPDAGPTMSKGQYSVAGGFRALPQAVQTEGALFQPPPAACYHARLEGKSMGRVLINGPLQRCISLILLAH